jgi:hypothetical protein
VRYIRRFGQVDRQDAADQGQREVDQHQQRDADRADGQVSSTIMIRTTMPLKMVMVRLADCWASNCPPYLTV